MKRAILLATFLLLPPTVDAVDGDGAYNTIFPTGNRSCGGYVGARDEARRGNPEKENQYIIWFMGFLTAYNWLKHDTWDIKSGLDQEALLLWLENYCKERPLEDFAGAMEAPTSELYPKRIRKAPK